MAGEVTPLRDAEWTLQCAYREKDRAKTAVTQAEEDFLRADRRYRAALKRVHELKGKKP